MVRPRMRHTTMICSIFNLALAGALAAQQNTVPPSPSPSPSPSGQELKIGDKPAKPKGEAEHKALPATKGSIEVLSDTMGVDFGPYLKRLRDQVQQHWYPLVPQSAMRPELKAGKVTLTFAILRDGKIAGLKIDTGSGSVALDRAAYGAITNSNPFPPLPQQFTGEYLLLRTHFLYNPGPELKQQADKPGDQAQKPKADSPKPPTRP
jgi:TonB family protein